MRCKAFPSALLLVCLPSCSLILDFSPTNLDSDSSITDPQFCDAFEPNETQSETLGIADGETLESAICPAGDVDNFAFTAGDSNLKSNTIITLELNFPEGQDLDLRLYLLNGSTGEPNLIFRNIGDANPTTIVHDLSESLDESEAMQANDYVVEVIGSTRRPQSDYTLSLSVDTELSPDL